MKAEYAIGDELAGYRIEALVGRGGMGVVYRAVQLSLQRTVAIKVLAPELAEDEKFRARFERESRLAALCDHPNIIPVYEAGETDGLLFIAMRWVDGNDLRAVLKREGPLDPERTLSILGQVAGALDAAHDRGLIHRDVSDAAHDRGLIHRDVKPANILVALPGGVGMQEHVYLSDFGIAKMSSSAAFTRTGFFVGTPDYAAPEQFTDQDLDGRVDVYAVGCLLFQCLAGSPPFVRTQDVAVMYAHLHDPPPRLSEQRPEIPEALDAVIATAMAKQRDDRYRTAGEVIRAARAALAVNPLRAMPDSVAETAAAAPTVAAFAEPAASTQPAAAARRSEEKPARMRRRRRVGILVAAGLALLAAGAVAIVLATRGDGSAAETTPAAALSATAAGSTTAASVASGGLAWSRVDDPATFGGEGGQEIARLAVLPDGSVVAAGSQGPPRAHDAVVWTSDGSAKVETFTKEVLTGAVEDVAYGISPAGGDSAVIVGYSQASPPHGDTEAAVWLRDGGTWQSVDAVPASPSYEKMNRVEINSSTGELAAVGAAGPGYDANGSPLPTDAAVWASDDGGGGWSRIDPDTFAKDGYQEMRGVSEFKDGFVAVGHDRQDGAVWLSASGTWTQLPSQPGLASGEGTAALEMRSVRPFGDGLVAVGYVVLASGDRDAAIWLSSDGEQWSRVADDDLGGAGDQEAIGVTTGSFRIVAVGCTGCDSSDSDAAVWMSQDGQEWTPAVGGDLTGGDGLVQLNDVAVAGDLLVAAGWEESGADRDAAVWNAAVSGG